MSDMVRANIQSMRDASQGVTRSATNIQTAVQTTTEQFRAVGPDRFMSEAADRLRSELASKTEQLNQISTELGKFSKQLDAAANDFEAAAR